MRCLTCHYSLKALTGNRCPECGREFDPNDPATFLHATSRRRTGWCARLVLAAISYFAAFLFMLPLGHYPLAMHNASNLEVALNVALWAVPIWPFFFLVLFLVWVGVRAAAIRW